MAFMTQWMGWKAIADQGHKVILNGTGGDEILWAESDGGR